MRSNALHKFLVIIGVLTIGMVWQTMSGLSEQYPITNFPPKGTRIIALGDSLTIGIGASGADHGYVSVLEKRLNITIANEAVSGDTTYDTIARLDRDVLSKHPDIVMILLGSNDYLRGEPHEDTFKNLRTIITRIQGKGAVVILLGARGGILNDTFAKDFTALARSTGSAFVPGVLDDILGNTKLMYDSVHPNNAGYLKMADKIAPTLEGVVLSAQQKRSR